MNKKGASIISLALCAVVLAFVTTALVVATNNSAMYRASKIAEEQNIVIETSSYTKVYRLNEVTNIARQAYVDNYLSFYDKEVDIDGFTALVMGDIMQKVPANQLENYNITVTEDGVHVENK